MHLSVSSEYYVLAVSIYRSVLTVYIATSTFIAFLTHITDISLLVQIALTVSIASLLHQDGSAALFVSACNGHIEVVSKLLEEGIDVNATLEVSVVSSSWFLFLFTLLILIFSTGFTVYSTP